MNRGSREETTVQVRGYTQAHSRVGSDLSDHNSQAQWIDFFFLHVLQRGLTRARADRRLEHRTSIPPLLAPRPTAPPLSFHLHPSRSAPSHAATCPALRVVPESHLTEPEMLRMGAGGRRRVAAAGAHGHTWSPAAATPKLPLPNSAPPPPTRTRLRLSASAPIYAQRRGRTRP